MPEYNRVLHKKWLAHNKRIHKQHIYDTRPVVDNNVPSSFRYPIIKLKKEQILEGKPSTSFSFFPSSNPRVLTRP